VQVFDLPRECIAHQLQLIESAAAFLKRMLENIPTEDRPASVLVVDEYRRCYLAYLLLISDVAQSLASKSLLPADLYKTDVS